MNDEQRRWRCPECQEESLIPVAAGDGVSCRRCGVTAPSVPACQPQAVADPGTGIPSSAVGTPAAEDFWEKPFWKEEAPGAAEFPARQGRRTAASGNESASPARVVRPKKRVSPAPAVLVTSLLIGGLMVAFVLWRVPLEATLWLIGGGGGESLLVGQPAVQRNPRVAAPLAALVEFETRRPAVASIEIDDGQRQWTYRPAGLPTTDHHYVVLGLRPGRRHELRVRLTGADGGDAVVSKPIAVSTPPLPEDFPPLRTLLSVPKKMEPGITLFAPNLWRDGERIYDYGYILAVDATGEVVWYFRADARIADLRLLSNGHLLYNDARNHATFEIDFLGNLVRKWWASGRLAPPDEQYISVPTDSLHHEVTETPSGNFLALSTELRTVENFPASEDDPAGPTAKAMVVGDVVVEYQKDGTVVDRLRLFDLLDPHRIGYGAFSNFWRSHYDEVDGEESHDWSHANAFHYDARSDTLIVSLRHQDCFVKIDRRSNEILWILGNPEGWRDQWRRHLLQPRGDLQWPYHQHGVELTPAGTILLYDNGNFQAVPPEPKRPAFRNYSRVVEFQVDEAERTVRQVWEYGGPEDEMFYAPFYGDADWLPQTGNILITDGGRIETADGMPADEIPSDHQWGRILEVTHTRPAEKVFEIAVNSGLGSGIGWSIYRSERLPDLTALSDLAGAGRAE